MFLSIKGQVLLPILPTMYLPGFFAPDVFLLVAFSFTEGFILKESILELDCSILL